MKFKLNFAIVILFVSGCNDNVNFDEINNSLPISSQIDYLENELKNISNSGLSVLTNPNIRTLLYDKISSKFDGDYNVLIEDLLINVLKGNQLIDKSVNYESLQESIRKIKFSDNIPLNAHIHIPFYEELNKEGILGQEVPIIIFAASDNSDKENYQGYKFELDGSISESVLVNEEFAMENEVWVFGINERYFEESIDKLNTFKYQNFSSMRTEASAYQRIVDMKVKCHKESWAAGASEVNVIVYAHDYEFGDWESVHNLPPSGSGIRNFSRNEVKNETWVNVNYGIVPNWDDNYPLFDWCSYVIFEYDPVASLNYVEWWSGSEGVEIAYRSSDVAYYSTPTAQYKASTTSISVNCIEFTQAYN